MAAVKKSAGSQARRISSIKPMLRGKPTLRGTRNMMAAKYRQANYSKAAAFRFWGAGVLTFLAIIFGGLWLGGFMPDVKQATANFQQERLMAMGFVVNKVDVMGEGRLREDDVRKALQITPGDYLFGPNLSEAKARVESLSWVDHALVRRLWPDRIVVQIIERKPYALWQHEGEVQLVDASGVAITDADPVNFATLPMIVGQGAADQATTLKAMLADYPALQTRVEACVYVSGSRWDIVMNDRSTTVRLPAANPRAALTRLADLQSRSRVLDREISVIDLRLGDRITLTPSDPTPA